jgi:hypothetical protein
VQEAVLLRQARLDRQPDGDAARGDVVELGAERGHHSLPTEAGADACYDVSVDPVGGHGGWDLR